MTIPDLIDLFVGLALLAYLAYALFYPERF
ncbi:MAG: potassium-transporting ATPase subunit F [Actinobacteria bacterium]|nr:potassium-transporting ATPase subunit F [Actinomycetota bacterium]